MNGSWRAPLSLLVGVALGAAYFACLRATVHVVVRGRHGPWLLLPTFALRLALAGAVFWLVLGWGAPHVVLALIGFLAARSGLLQRASAHAVHPPERSIGPWS